MDILYRCSFEKLRISLHPGGHKFVSGTSHYQTPKTPANQKQTSENFTVSAETNVSLIMAVDKPSWTFCIPK